MALTIQDRINNIDTLYDQAVLEYQNSNYTGSTQTFKTVYYSYNSLHTLGYLNMDLAYLAKLQTNIAKASFYAENYPESLIYFLEGFKTQHLIYPEGNAKVFASYYNDIAVTYSKLEEFELSAAFYQKFFDATSSSSAIVQEVSILGDGDAGI